ncbi:MAG TPA: hypothetical protein PKV06_09075, partial [bacterium]|nr:hypothetical protein [bacterium]
PPRASRGPSLRAGTSAVVQVFALALLCPKKRYSPSLRLVGEVTESMPVDQAFVKDPNKMIKDLVADLSKKLGKPVTIRRFERFRLGE